MKILIILFVFSSFSYGQNTLSGSIKNTSGESLDAATIFLVGTKYMAASDVDGTYHIDSIPSGTYTIKVAYVGYKSIVETVDFRKNLEVHYTLAGEIFQLDQVEIQANRAKENGPFTKINLKTQDIAKQNHGQDVPFVLQWTPSMVVSSDAGTGIGYTNMRLRGSDQTRINVTLNGAPVNDAESHNVFWVNLPDLMSSTTDVQIQRGVGTTSNGAGAFGGTVSINTSRIKTNPFAEISSGVGSFGTRRLSIAAGTGLMNYKYAVDARYSQSVSDGYTDRGSASLTSFYLSAVRVWEKSSLRFNYFNGSEVTYQSWYGTPAAKLGIGNDDLASHYSRNVGTVYKTVQDSINLFSSDRRYNYYTNEIQNDDYGQDYLQLIYNHQWSPSLRTKALLYYTRGLGAFGEFRPDDPLTNYGVRAVDETVNTFDAKRFRWLNNHLIGANFDGVYTKSSKLKYEGGLAYNSYFGDHYGNILANSAVIFPVGNKAIYRYYFSESLKKDFSTYARSFYDITPKTQFTVDIQLRLIDYTIKGANSDLRQVSIHKKYTFINPKVGFSYHPSSKQLIYASYALGQKEPTRGDFVDVLNSPEPRREQLHNVEAGYELKNKTWQFQTNMYYMAYRDQLVLTGALNDVGAPLRINVPSSFRLGWESDVKCRLSPKFLVEGNLSISRNKIEKFEEVIYDYTNGADKITNEYVDTDISFSPSVIQGTVLQYCPNTKWEMAISSKYVSQQYLDNTSSSDRSMPSFHYQQLRVNFNPTIKKIKTCNISFVVNNLFDEKYVSNGYTYSYIYQDRVDENYYYPQAGRNYMVNVKFGF